MKQKKYLREKLLISIFFYLPYSYILYLHMQACQDEYRIFYIYLNKLRITKHVRISHKVSYYRKKRISRSHHQMGVARTKGAYNIQKQMIIRTS